MALEQLAEKKPATKPPTQKNEQKTAGSTQKMDTVTLKHSQENLETYGLNAISNNLAAGGYEMLRKLVTSMLEEQGIDYTVAIGTSTININELSQEEAQALIADEGYFGIEQTSDRIVEFAIGAAGGDVSKLDEIKAGVQQGFNDALKAFGGTLPDISHDTLDAIMEKLDTWAHGAGQVEAKPIG